jgi:predicted lipoprotein with Yx(FWY)xxD motif
LTPSAFAWDFDDNVGDEVRVDVAVVVALVGGLPGHAGVPMLGSPPLAAAAIPAATTTTARPAGTVTVLRTVSSLGSTVMGVGTPRARVWIAVLAALAAAFVLVAGASSAKSGVTAARHATRSVTVKTARVKGLGTILVNNQGLTLYMFVPDHQKKVTCKGSCAALWPPLKIKAGQKPTAGGLARRRLLGTDKNPSGGLVVTYNKWPLYTYVADRKPGQATGQALNNSGGLWYVLSPRGQVIKKKP